MFVGEEHVISPEEVMVSMRIKYKQIMVDRSNDAREDSFDHMKTSSTTGALCGAMLIGTSFTGSVIFLGIGFVSGVLSMVFAGFSKYKNYKSIEFSEEAILMDNFENFAKGYVKVHEKMSEMTANPTKGFKVNTDFFKEAFSSMKKGEF